MTVVVFSDVHGRTDRVQALLERQRHADAVLFLGDGIRDLPNEVQFNDGRLFAAVRGNCDRFITWEQDQYPEELFLCLEEYTVMMFHGHLHSVKAGIGQAARYAAERGADVLLYGHTHVAEERYFPEGSDLNGFCLPKPLWILNPGSLGRPMDGKPSFGVMELRNGQILLSHGIL